MSDLWVVRHGATEWSETGRHTGRTDVPLTEAGRAAAVAVGDRLRAEHPDAFALVLTSPLSRAAETCALAGYGDAAEPEPDLVEWDYGDIEGVTTPRWREDHAGWSLWTDGCPDGESAADVGARADRVLERALAAGGDVLAFGHGHMLRVVAARWLQLAPELGRILVLPTAGVGVLGWEREDPVVRRWG